MSIVARFPTQPPSSEVPHGRSSLLVTALTLAAVFCYLPGILLPALRVERLGRVHESGIAEGCLTLFREGDIFLGVIVGLSALVVPPLKLAGLLYLSGELVPSPRTRRIHFVLECAGRFGCLEMYLAAVVVAYFRLGAIVNFEVRLGMYPFALSVLLSLAASACLRRLSVARESVE